MLHELTVENYAIIEKASIRPAMGLNVLTGETGAGKSIIVGALSFVLGERVSDDVVRKGADRCRVEALFGIGGGHLKSRLAELGLPAEISQVRVAREIVRGGRSRSSINGRGTPISQVRSLGDMLVDFHGQHEHQQLLHAKSHIDFLDGFARLEGARERFASRHLALVGLRKQITEIEQEIAYIRSKEEFIRYEIQEIEQLDLKENEDVAIEREINLLEHAEKIIEDGSSAVDAIYDRDDSATDLLSAARGSLERIGSYSDRLASLAESIEQAEVITKEVAETLRHELSRIDLDASRLEALRDRRAIIERIKRKYGETLDSVQQRLRRLKTGLDNREDLEYELRELKGQKEDLESEVAAAAVDLSRKRRVAAKRFERLAEAETKSLGIAGGQFRVVFEDLEEGEEICAEDGKVLRIGEYGMDSVEFFVRTNPGEDMLPLRRIASGGEISRVMLALKKILAEIDEVGTLVFDEIDSGIGGTIADVIAGKLSEVARSRQVICITHLAQIAGPADLHLAVGKSTVRGRTVTSVSEVKGDARVKELARMIGGKRPPESAKVHAEEILKRSVAK
jgi:DNA repair protein RecN (Recombination protein N)